jgi:hypothetical protein
LGDLLRELGTRAETPIPVGTAAQPRSIFWTSVAKILLINIIWGVWYGLGQFEIISLFSLASAISVQAILSVGLGAWVGSPIRTSRLIKYIGAGLANAILSLFIVASLAIIAGHSELSNIFNDLKPESLSLVYLMSSSVLAFVTGAFASDFIHRLSHPLSQSGTIANRIAASLISGTGAAQGQNRPTRVQGFVAGVFALLPSLLSVAGTIVAAYLGYLAKSGK